MRAVGYFREGAGGRRGDIGRQNRLFLDFCEQEGYQVVATFAEEGKPGSSSAFVQLLSFLREPEKGFVAVVLAEPGVLADDALVAATRYLQIERLGARIHFIDGVEPGEDPLDTVLGLWSAAHDDTRRDKVRSALRRKAVRGEVLGRPPYGYRVGPHNRLELVEDEALVVRYIFRLYLQEGLGIRLIARRLNEEGLRTRRNRPWSMVSIRDILRNRAYLGTYQRLGVRVPGTHAAIVSPEDFRRVQQRLEDRRTNYSPREVKGFLLSGLVVCDVCGNRMIGVSRRQSWKRRRDGSEQVAHYRYYQCESRTNQGLCSYNTQRAAELEEAVRKQLAGIDPRELASAGEDAAVISHWKAEAARLRERLQQIDRRLVRALEGAASARSGAQQLRKEGLLLAEERLKVEDELRDAEWRGEHYASSEQRRRTRGAALSLLISQWDQLSQQDKQPLLRELLDRVHVSSTDVRLVLRP